LLLFPILQSLLSASALSFEPKPTPFRRCCRRRRRRRLCKPSPAHCSEPTPLSLPHSNFQLPTQPLRSPTTNTSAPRERCWTPSLRRSLPSAVRRCLARTLARTCTKHAHCTLSLKLTWHPSGHARCPSWPLTPRLAEQTLPSPCGTKNPLRQLLGMCTVSLAGRAARRVKGLP
jgi:hypothetical protein